jgi:hypothetical protein
MASNASRTAWAIAFQKTPILLTRGIATNLPGGILPIVALTEAANFATGLLQGKINIDLDNFFANWKPMPGSALISFQAATYPFANQAIAANAIISQPLPISMLMTCPAQLPPASGNVQLAPTLPGQTALAQKSGGYPGKLAVITALQTTLALHSGLGGTYSVMTPSFIYTDCLLLNMRDVSGGESQQVQYTYQFDFLQPLVSLASAQSALNSLMQKLTNNTPISGATNTPLPTALPSSIPSPLVASYPSVQGITGPSAF